MPSKGNIMVLDTDADVALLLEEVLIGAGYLVCRCPVAATAASIACHRPDALILDLNPMRPYATVQLLSQLREHSQTRDLSVLVVSTDARVLAILAEPLQYFGCATLIKPFDIDDVVDRLDALMAARQASHPIRNFAREIVSLY